MPYRKPSAKLTALLNQQIVVDTDSSYVYIGRLKAISSDCLVLADVDAHDTHDSNSSKEHYAHETRRLGPRPNRKEALVLLARVLSISRLDDIIRF
jgi:small nuclear ribonucleoprotein (snRNP)-like protein